MTVLVYLYDHWLKTTWFMVGAFFIVSSFRGTLRIVKGTK